MVYSGLIYDRDYIAHGSFYVFYEQHAERIVVIVQKGVSIIYTDVLMDVVFMIAIKLSNLSGSIYPVREVVDFRHAILEMICVATGSAIMADSNFSTVGNF